jgi:hypothetical protein
MIESGLSLLTSTPQHYLDLPAFDAIRRLGSQPKQYLPIPLKEQILVLCSFDKNYLRYCWPTLSAEIGTAFAEENPNVFRVIDLTSPRLVSHRLYEEIRRSSACLVDWTGWRPNVFYELGVRLSVNEIGPVCVISEVERQTAAATGGLRQNLLHLFAPLAYHLEEDNGEFRQLLRARFEEVTTPFVLAASVRDQAMAHGHTFQVVFGEIDLEQEPGGTPVYRELREAAESLTGVDPQMQGQPPLLFYQNRKLMSQAREAAIERLLAGWYYLRERHRAGQRPPEDPLHKEYLSLGQRLALALLESRQPQDQALGQEIGREVGIFKLHRGQQKEDSRG